MLLFFLQLPKDASDSWNDVINWTSVPGYQETCISLFSFITLYNVCIVLTYSTHYLILCQAENDPASCVSDIHTCSEVMGDFLCRRQITFLLACEETRNIEKRNYALISNPLSVTSNMIHTTTVSEGLQEA